MNNIGKSIKLMLLGIGLMIFGFCSIFTFLIAWNWFIDVRIFCILISVVFPIVGLIFVIVGYRMKDGGKVSEDDDTVDIYDGYDDDYVEQESEKEENVQKNSNR